MNTVFSQASTFAGKCSNADAFEAQADKMNKRTADLKENDQSVPGFTSPKDMVRWAFIAKQGDISQVFDVGGNRYVVAHLVQISPKGISPLEVVKDEVKLKALQDKKAEKLIGDMKAAMQGATNIASLGQKVNTPAATQQRLSFAMYNIPGMGREDALLGTMAAIKPNTLSQPIQGEAGVYVIQVDSVYTSGASDFRMVQQQKQQALQSRTQNDLYNALQKKSNFVNHMGKFF